MSDLRADKAFLEKEIALLRKEKEKLAVIKKSVRR